MNTWADEYFSKERQKGWAEGRALSVLEILELRGVDMDANTRWHIFKCTDLATLNLWFKRAITASHISEVLDDSPQ